MKKVEWRATVKAGGWGSAMKWLVSHWQVTTIVFIGAGTNAMGNIVSQMSPQFVDDVLGVNPALAMYIFAPAAIGAGIAVVAAVPLQNRFGERRAAMVGLATGVVCIILMAFIVPLTDLVNLTNPLWYIAKIFDWGMDESVLALAWVSFPAGMAGAVTGLSTQTYINRRLPFRIQGRTFALQSSLMNLIAIPPLLLVGVIGSNWSMELAILLVPFMLFGFIAAIIGLGFKLAKVQEPPRGEVFTSFWRDPDTAEDYDDDTDASTGGAAAPAPAG